MIITSAPAIANPLGSRTVPVIDPVGTWAYTVPSPVVRMASASKKQNANANTHILVASFMAPPVTRLIVGTALWSFAGKGMRQWLGNASPGRLFDGRTDRRKTTPQ